MIKPTCARRRCATPARICLFAAHTLAPAAMAETIDLSFAPTTANPGETFAFSVLLADNTTPLYGYALDVNVLPLSGATGSIASRLSPAVPATTFDQPNNLIAAAPGGGLAAVSSISAGDHNGVDIVALNSALANVDPAGPGHDALAMLVFDVSADASGFFSIELGNVGTSLTTLTSADVPAFANVSYTSPPVTIQVVPEPGGFGLLIAAGAMLARRRRRRTPRDRRRKMACGDPSGR